jgi:hypothetical protein
MIKYLIVALIVYLIVSQFLFIKEGFNSHVNAYIRPKIRQLRLNKETFITKVNRRIVDTARKIGIN